MQTVTDVFKSAAVAKNRFPAASAFISWLREYEGADWFTIGISSIGGPDVIKGDNNVIAEADNYSYNEETGYLMSIEYDRWLEEPVFSVARALFDVILDNNDDRFTPGFDPEIGDFIATRRPIRAYVGFNFSGINQLIQQFVGMVIDYPKVDKVNKTLTLHGIDFSESLWTRPLEETTLFADQRTDEILSSLLQTAGLATDQFVLDEGFITIPFAFFEKGDKIGQIIAKLCEAEQGQFYADELGTYHFENRTHWLNAPHTIPQLTITDDMVISESAPRTDNIINTVEITASPRAVVAANEKVWDMPDTRLVAKNGGTLEFFITYDDPMYSVVTPTPGVGASSYFTANSQSDGGGTPMTSDFEIITWDVFSKATKVVVRNNNVSTDGYLTELIVFGKPAKISQELYIKMSDQDSIGIYEEHVLKIENDYIQEYETAKSIATSILNNRKDPANYLELKIAGQPHLQLGDRVTRSGEDYFITRIKTSFTAAGGLVQTLNLVKRTISTIS